MSEQSMSAENKLMFPMLPAFLGFILLAAVIGIYWPVLTTWMGLVLKNDDASFALVLPFVSAYIIYRKWPQIWQQPWQPSWWGLLLTAGGLGLYILGELFQSFYIPAFSFVVVLAGSVWLLGGWGLLRQVSFPLLLLVFMIPYEGFLVRKTTLPLQLISSQLAAAMLKLMGYTVYVQGNIIDLGERQLNVVAACSGLRYVINMWALGIVFCYFFQRQVWKIGIILAALVPFAIVGNALRIATIGVWPLFEHGMWHTSLGLSIFFLGFDYLKLVNWTVNRLQAPPARQEEKPAVAPAVSSRASFGLYVLTALALVVLAGPLARNAASSPPQPLQQGLEYFPLTLGGWRGVFYPIEQRIFEVTTADTYFNAHYQDGQGEQVNLWIAYYENMKRSKSFHSPAVCMTGSGLLTLQTEEIQVAPGVPATAMLMEQDGRQLLVYYWYWQAGRWIAGDYSNKLAIAQDLLFKGRSDGALIRIDTPVGQDISLARKNLGEFARLLIPQLREFFPH